MQILFVHTQTHIYIQFYNLMTEAENNTFLLFQLVHCIFFFENVTKSESRDSF